MRLRGELTEEEYKAKKAKLLEQKAQQGQHAANSGNAKELIDEAYKKTFNFVFQAKAWLKNGDIKKKRELLSELGSNSTLMGRILSISMPEELEIIKNGIKQEPAASARFEQENRLINKGRTPLFRGGSSHVAREVGFEPTTHRLHLTLIFLLGVDYIIIPDGGMRGASRSFDLARLLSLRDSL